ncbi:MAG TPA: carotenoid biosynthesis protein [Longimicrobiales bacterium]|nr:carotenoid biosynthesis protein [Longimicrobiales bacterium]
MNPLQLSPRRGERVVLGLLLAFTVLAVTGYGVFALHPQRLVTPMAARFYGISFQFFAQIHILLAALALGWVLVGRLGARWLPALGVVGLVSFVAEHIGTGYGIPFGGYGYTSLLGLRVGPRVPVLIPVSWFLMSVPSWVVAQRALPHDRLRRIGLAALFLVAWDLALDPAMSFLTPYWRWAETGPYYGMPWVNLLGWYLTGLIIMRVLDALGPRLGLTTLPTRWLAAYYGLVLLMPLGMVAAAGLWPAVAATLAGVGVCAFLARRGLVGGDDEKAPAPREDDLASDVLAGVS